MGSLPKYIAAANRIGTDGDCAYMGDVAIKAIAVVFEMSVLVINANSSGTPRLFDVNVERFGCKTISWEAVQELCQRVEARPLVLVLHPNHFNSTAKAESALPPVPPGKFPSLTNVKHTFIEAVLHL